MLSLLNTLSGAPKASLDSFMKDFVEKTVDHPFCRHLRILCGPDPDKHGVVFELSAWDGAIHLSLIQSLVSGIGEGRRGMNFVKDLADKHQVAITGSIKRLGNEGLTTADLRSWYKRNGFQVAANGDIKRPVGGAKPPAKKTKARAPAI